MEKNASAVSSERNDPTTRPCTPRWAEEDTALLVPFVGPKTAMGASRRAPTTRPVTVAASPCQNDRPNRIGNAPRKAVAKVLAPPNETLNKSKALALRSFSGIRSMP